MRYKCRQKMVSRPSLKEACDLPKAQGAVVIKHDDVTGSAAASNLELYPEKHGSSCCIHKRYNVTSQHSRAEFPQGFWLWQWLNISTTGFCFKTLFVSAGIDIRGYSCLQSSGTASICRPLAGRKGGLGVRWGTRRYLFDFHPTSFLMAKICLLPLVFSH
jgi:hypothetical protein